MILFGASGHAKVIIDLLQENKKVIDKIYDDRPKYDFIHGIIVEHNKITTDLDKEAIISIGNNKIRKKIANTYALKYISAFHPKSSISKYATIGKGTVAMANSSVNADAIVGEHCIINTNAVVEHDCKLDDFVHVSPNASLAGNVEVGEGTHIGIGASVIQGVKIGKWSTIGAGAVIISDVPDFATVVGNPGKIIKIKERIGYEH